jgi:hypothetical protein
MDDVTWVAARAAQAVSRHLNAAESEATKFSTRLRRAPVAALDTAASANEAPPVPMAALEAAVDAALDAEPTTGRTGSRSAA